MEITSLTETVASRIVDFIQRERIGTGEKIPTESELAEWLCVSCATIREAERLLAGRNVLVIRRGIGAFVSPKQGISEDPFGFGKIRDQDRLNHDILELREQFEPLAAELAAIYATEDDILRMQRRLERMELLEQDAVFLDEDKAFHQTITDASHNLALKRMNPLIEEAFTAFQIATQKCMPRDLTIRTHRNVYRAIVQRDPIAAREAMLLHLLELEKYN